MSEPRYISEVHEKYGRDLYTAAGGGKNLTHGSINMTC